MRLLGMIGAPEIIIILLLVLILFGGKKIPELMRGLGKGVKEYKNAVNSVDEEVKKIDNAVAKNEAPKEDNNTEK